MVPICVGNGVLVGGKQLDVPVVAVGVVPTDVVVAVMVSVPRDLETLFKFDVN